MSSTLGPGYDYEPPVVVDIEHPKYGLLWPHLDTLRYRASLLECRTGIFCRVARIYQHSPAEETETRGPEPEETFEVLTKHATAGPLEYAGALSWLDAFEEGVNECRWVYSENSASQ